MREERVCSGGEVDFVQASHAATLLAELKGQRLERRFTDILLRVGGRDFHCHRNVLTAASPYFKSMFLNDMKESREDSVEMRGITADSMELVLDYAYTGRVRISAGSVQGLLGAADLLGLLPVRDACESFLGSQLHASNCLGVHLLAERHSCATLSRRAWAFALENFQRVGGHREILELPVDTLVRYLSSDELVVGSEKDVCDTMLKWILESVDQRHRHTHALMAHLRRHLLPRTYLMERVLNNELIAKYMDTSKVLLSCYGNSEIFVTGSALGERRRTRSRKVVVVVGGVGPANIHLRELKYYDPVGRAWGTLARLPDAARSVSGVEAVDNDVYVAGFKGDVSVYRTASGRWEALACPESEAGTRQRRTSSSLDGCVYLIGGYDGVVRLARVDRFDTNTKEWTQVAPLPDAVSSPAAVSYGGKLYVFGGAVSNEMATDRVRCYDPATDQWLPRASMPHALSGIAAQVLGDRIYVVGCLSQIVHRYDPLADAWGQVASMRRTRALCSAAVCDDKLYVMGGEDQPNSLTDSMECFDPGTNRWAPCYALPYPVKLHKCVTIIKRL